MVDICLTIGGGIAPLRSVGSWITFCSAGGNGIHEDLASIGGGAVGAFDVTSGFYFAKNREQFRSGNLTHWTITYPGIDIPPKTTRDVLEVAICPHVLEFFGPFFGNGLKCVFFITGSFKDFSDQTRVSSFGKMLLCLSSGFSRFGCRNLRVHAKRQKLLLASIPVGHASILGTIWSNLKKQTTTIGKPSRLIHRFRVS